MPAAVASLKRLGVETPSGRSFTGIRIITTRNGHSAEGTFRDGLGLGVRRTELSRVLRERAEAVGVEFAAKRVRAITQEDRWVETCGIRARWMIAADGLHSSICRLTGARRETKGRSRWGVRAHLAAAPWTDRVEIYYSTEGEAYVTPISDTTVGVALLTQTPGRFGDLMAAYPRLQARVESQLGREMGAGPFPSWLKEKVQGRILFVGDAAGFLDPITGEGIRLGFDAARLSVAAILAENVARYDRAWRRMARPYWWLTSVTVAVRRNRVLDRMLVPTLNAVPGLFDQALSLLGGGASFGRMTKNQSGGPVEGHVVPDPIHEHARPVSKSD